MDLLKSYLSNTMLKNLKQSSTINKELKKFKKDLKLILENSGTKNPSKLKNKFVIVFCFEILSCNFLSKILIDI